MKKNLNKILLEAVNRGINLALDDFEDNNLQLLSHGLIKSKNYTKDYLNLMDNFVDLGLQSGTLWAKYNLGANYDILINHPDDAKPDDWVGDYYAFGCIEPKTTSGYKFLEKRNNNNKYIFLDYYTKYNENDNLTHLELCDDPAYNNNPYKDKLNINICVPSDKQFEELKENTTKSFFYDNGLFICVLTSKINGKEIVFPLCGYLRTKDIVTLEKTNPTYGYYMTNSIYPEKFDWLYNIFIIESNMLHIDTVAREHGVNVRPVLMK